MIVTAKEISFPVVMRGANMIPTDVVNDGASKTASSSSDIASRPVKRKANTSKDQEKSKRRKERVLGTIYNDLMDEGAENALIEEEEKLMLKDETLVSKRIQSEHHIIENDTQDKACAASECSSISLLTKEKALETISSITNQTRTKSSLNYVPKNSTSGCGVWLGTRRRSTASCIPLSTPSNISRQITEVANPIIDQSPQTQAAALVIRSHVVVNEQYLIMPENSEQTSALLTHVPNPILPSSDKFDNMKDTLSFRDENEPAESPVMKDVTTSSSTAPATCDPSDKPPLSPMLHKNDETFSSELKRCSVSFASVVTRSDRGVDANMSVASLPPVRKRIFSIDIDPEGLEFGVSVSETLVGLDPQGSVDFLLSYKGNAASMLTHSAHDFNVNKQNEIDLVTIPRDRAMSFELFSFGMNEDDAVSLYPVEGLTAIVQVNGRPRGESIIFDPVSFIDGGIHEENALLRTRRNSLALEEHDEIAIMNTPGFLEPPLSDGTLLSMKYTTNQALSLYQVPVTDERSDTRKHVTKSDLTILPEVDCLSYAPFSLDHNVDCRNSKAISKKGNSFIRGQNKVHSQSTNARDLNDVIATAAAAAAASPQLALTIVSSTPPPINTEETIHMPQGSAAAAAAAMSRHSQLIPTSINGTIAHTACPVSILNKEGRIGIYLPEARKERIEKFHSKRKMRIWRKRIKYDCRKKLADSRPRIKGRFVKSMDPDSDEDEDYDEE